MENVLEQWKPVPGYEGLYEVSDLGNLKRVDKPKHTALVRKASTNGGYFKYLLCNGGTITNKYLHRMVAEAFIPNEGGKPQVNHINGNKADNRACNLEWATARENRNHAIVTGLHVGCPVTQDTANKIKDLVCVGTPANSISNIVGCGRTTIYNVRRVNYKLTK